MLLHISSIFLKLCITVLHISFHHDSSSASQWLIACHHSSLLTFFIIPIMFFLYYPLRCCFIIPFLGHFFTPFHQVLPSFDFVIISHVSYGLSMVHHISGLSAVIHHCSSFSSFIISYCATFPSCFMICISFHDILASFSIRVVSPHFYTFITILTIFIIFSSFSLFALCCLKFHRFSPFLTNVPPPPPCKAVS